MKPYAILQSNLLDIIFENRNKDYGAYPLRKNYNKRLTAAVFISIVTFVLTAFLFASAFKPSIEKESRIIKVDGLKLNTYTEILKISPQKRSNVLPAKKMVVPADAPPVITDEKNINKPVATKKIELPSNKLTGTLDFPFATNNLGGESGRVAAGGNPEIVPAIEPVKINRSVPVENADIMPQYPGGIKALLAFLKNNIHAPADVDEDKVITVKIKFVINYEGKIESFSVAQSGGGIFDNEVIRVLMKMPLWTPGKSHGKDVSVYYYLPVKFTSGL
ncbi:MAG: energy transducer TonB [Bacteroidota bacterium]|nr:energy transducer TonB [Bacteroidota bacterium]